MTTPHMEVGSESKGTRDKEPERPPPPVQLSSESAAKMTNLNEIIAQSFEDGQVGVGGDLANRMIIDQNAPVWV